VGDALSRAVKEVKAGRPALVDTVSQYRWGGRVWNPPLRFI